MKQSAEFANPPWTLGKLLHALVEENSLCRAYASSSLATVACLWLTTNRLRPCATECYQNVLCFPEDRAREEVLKIADKPADST